MDPDIFIHVKLEKLQSEIIWSLHHADLSYPCDWPQVVINESPDSVEKVVLSSLHVQQCQWLQGELKCKQILEKCLSDPENATAIVRGVTWKATATNRLTLPN